MSMRKLSSVLAIALSGISGIGDPAIPESRIVDAAMGYPMITGSDRSRGSAKQSKRNAHRAQRLANKRARKARIFNAQRRRGAA